LHTIANQTTNQTGLDIINIAQEKTFEKDDTNNFISENKK
jgi:hypothetical protein